MQQLLAFSKVFLKSRILKTFTTTSSLSTFSLSYFAKRIPKDNTMQKRCFFSHTTALVRDKKKFSSTDSKVESYEKEELNDFELIESNDVETRDFEDIFRFELGDIERKKEETLAKEPPSAKVKKIKPVAQKIQVFEKDLKEKFIKGGGNGGQAINKTNSCVELTHIPTGIVIQCQKTRSQAQNRKIARKLLLEKLDDRINGKLSKSALKAAKFLKQKKKQRKRALAKVNRLKAGEKANEDDLSKKDPTNT